MKLPKVLRAKCKWRALLLALIMAGLPGALAIGAGPATADSASSSPTGYFTFGSQAFGDASNCPIPPVIDQVGVFANQPVVGMAITPNCGGGWLAAADGGIFSFGDASFYGSAGNLHLNEPIVGITATPDGKGYWLVAADGGIFSFGDAQFFGSAGDLRLNQPIVAMATTPDGEGYWLVGADGGVFSYGDAGFYGSMGGTALRAPVVSIAPTHDGKGYWLVGADGGVFSFGDAHFYGSEGGTHLLAPITGISSTPDGLGYWLVAEDGGVFTFGDAGFFGSLAELAADPGGSEGSDVIANPVIGLTPSPSGQGYFLLMTTPAINPTEPYETGYELAKREWQITGYEASYTQSTTLVQAAAYLTMGEGVDPGNTSEYPTAVQELLQLASIPEMDVTPAQDAEAETDTAALTSFFDSQD